MSIQRIIAVVCLLIGGVAIGVSTYIQKEVEAGKQEISSGEQKVEAGKKLFNIVPETSPLGDVFTGSAEGQIAQGKRDIAYYEKVSKFLRIGGILFIAIGILAFVLKKKKRKKKGV